MEINNLKKDNILEINNKNEVGEMQKNFLETMLGKSINIAFDIGIRALLPNYLEDEIINIKDNLFNYGLKEGITKSIDEAIDFGKNAIGIITGNFENISQMKDTFKVGGLIDGISSLTDAVLNKVTEKGLIKNNVAKIIKNGKDVILSNIESNIEKSFTKQYQELEYMGNYINNWKTYFENHNFNGMEKEYKKIEKQINKIVPIENTINEARNIEILHNLIKNNGKNFNLSEEELELVKNLR